VKSALIEIHHLPSISYFAALQSFDIIILEKHENYIKQSYRNRYFINTSQGLEMLTIPVLSKQTKIQIDEIRIDYGQKWVNNHCRTLQSAYGRAPFFEYYWEDLHQILFNKYDFLYDLNHDLLSLCLKWLNWKREIKDSVVYQQHPDFGLFDLRNAINAKNYERSNKYYNPVPYNQVFGNKFVMNLSIVDLIFCTGPEAGKIIYNSAVDDRTNIKPMSF